MSPRRRVPAVTGPRSLRASLVAMVAVVLCLIVSTGVVVGQSGGPPAPVGSVAPPLPGTSAPPGASTTPAVPASPAVSRVRALADREVLGFLPYWELANAAQTVDLDRLTTLAWFGVEAGRNGKLIWKQGNGSVPPGAAGWRDDRWRSIMADAQAKGVRVVLTVERFSWAAQPRTQTIRLLRSAKARTRLAHQIRDELIQSGADGVNLDFEPLPSEVRTQFTLFVQELRAALDAATAKAGRPSMQITFDITAAVDDYDIPALTADDAADAVFLMAYDFRGATADYAASISPLDDPQTGFDIRTTVAALLSVADPAHTILGLPWYGRAWTTEGPEPFSPTRSGTRLTVPGVSLYEDAIGIARDNGRAYDPVAETAWTVYVVKRPGCSGCPEAWRQVWYDDVDGFGAKVAFAADEGMRGVGMWALGYTGAYRGMWTVLALASGDLVDTKPPVGDATISAGASGKQQGLPVVKGDVTLRFSAHDEQGGSELAFVRVANEGSLDGDGQLVNGSTWPATTSVEWSLEDGPVVVPPKARPVRTPGPSGPPILPDASAEPGYPAGPDATGAPEPTSADGASATSSVVPAASPVSPDPASSDGPPASAAPSDGPVVSAAPGQGSSTGSHPIQGPRSIFVQWRDVAGNWSAPVLLDVWYAPRGSVMPEVTPSPAPSPSAAPSAAPSEADASAAPSQGAASAAPSVTVSEPSVVPETPVAS